MAQIVIRTVTNTLSETISLFIPGNNAKHAAVTIAPSATLDLLTVMTDDELASIQPELSGLITRGSLSQVATVDLSTLSIPSAFVAQPAVVAAAAIAEATTDASIQTGSYVQADVQSIATLVNALKADYNTMVTLVNELRTKLNATNGH
jgi:hypothetical protein